MNYKDAFAIGSRVEGYIKCHYAELHSPSLGKLFSLQDNNFTSKNEAVGAGYDPNPNVDEHMIINYDIPVVETDEISEDKLVPVRLTSYAKQQIVRLYSKGSKKYIVYRVYPNGYFKWDGNEKVYIHQPGERQILFETYDRKAAYAAVKSGSTNGQAWSIGVDESTREIKPKYQELIDGINKDGVFYVKPVAIDWIPTDIVNVGLEKDLTEAQRKLDAAKALLVTAGAATILL